MRFAMRKVRVARRSVAPLLGRCSRYFPPPNESLLVLGFLPYFLQNVPMQSPGKLGIEWIIDAAGCDGLRLRDGDRLAGLCAAIVAELDLHIVGQPQWHQFPSPGGWTGMYLLTESHLTIHTFPEHRSATLNLYCCRARQEWDWETKLAEWLGATDVDVRSAERGMFLGTMTGGPR